MMLCIVFLPLIEILTKIINHTNKETVYNPLTGKGPPISREPAQNGQICSLR
jgi:hypothetical protein